MQIISRRITLFFLVAALASAAASVSAQSRYKFLPAPQDAPARESDRLKDSAVVLNEIMGAEDNAIPKWLLRDAAALVVIPSVKKGAFIIGGEFGRGVVIVRQRNGEWGSPGFVSLGGGSFGFQIGGQTTDVILVVKNRSGIEKLVKNKFKLGVDASVAAGPVGRAAEANTDAQMQAQILAYSRSQGLFAGISLEGAVLKLDNDANIAVYGRKLSGRDVLNSRFKRPEASNELYQALARHKD